MPVATPARSAAPGRPFVAACWSCCLLHVVPLSASGSTGRETLLAAKEPVFAELADCRVDATGVRATLARGGRNAATESVVRWGAPETPQRRPFLLFADGSRLLSDREWSPTGVIRVDARSVQLRRGRGRVRAPRDEVRWAVLDPEAAPDVGPAELPEAADDAVHLRGGDVLVGSVTSLTGETLTVEVAGAPIETPLEQLAAIRFATTPTPAETPAEAPAACLVGLADGSLLRGRSLTVGDGAARVDLPAGFAVEAPADELAFVQPLRGPARYLSDLEPVDYQHTPYLDLSRPYARDAGFRGGLLVGGGRRAAKGLAVPSASRLIYRLDGAPQRFRAHAAVADPPEDAAAIGNVTFRVYLVKDGAFVPAYDGGVVRVGDRAAPIDVDASGAAALALVVDYAEGGDAGDEALWLDARLEPSP